MPTIHLETEIDVPIELCFDLARSIEIHCRTTAHTRERAVGEVGEKTAGLLEGGDVVTFEAVHLGVRQRLTAQIVEFERPHRFADVMLRGAFQSLRHVHEFERTAAGTRMRDTLVFASPLGILGMIADKLLLERYMRRFLLARNENLKRLAESGEYRQVTGWGHTISPST